jgi:hypothetical protein
MPEQSETSADYPHFRVYGVRLPVSPAETSLLLEALERSGSRFALSAASQLVTDLTHGRDVELGEPECLEAIRLLENLEAQAPLAGGLLSLKAQLVAWRDLQ